MSPAIEHALPPCITTSDSAVAAVRAVHAVLLGRHFDPFPQPPAMRFMAVALNQLPVSARVRIMDRLSASIGQPAAGFARIRASDSAGWVTGGYVAEKYPGCVLGAPGLAVTFLSGLTGFPYLPQPLLYSARRAMARDNSRAYLDAGRELAEPLVAREAGIEAIVHFDPVHDRFLIGRVVFVRLKYIHLPDAYREFIQKRLLPGSTIVLLDCGYKWPLARISDRLFFQLGGLGGLPPEDYINETPELKRYREQWGAPPDASWKIDTAFSTGPESEWGSTGSFLDEAEEVAKAAGHRVIRFRHAHPGDLSRAVFRLYDRCRNADSIPARVYIGTFTHTEPRFPLVTGSIPLWLPFITEDNLRLARDVLEERRSQTRSSRPEGIVFATLHPSFCQPPDLVSLDSWRSLFSGYFEQVRFLGVDLRKYPADISAYVSVYPAVVKAAREFAVRDAPFRNPTFDDIRDCLT